VITQGAGKADFAIAITSPSGTKVKAHVIPTHEGFLVNFTPTELGEYLLSVSFGGEPLPQAPLRFVCMPGSDYTKVCMRSLSSWPQNRFEIALNWFLEKKRNYLNPQKLKSQSRKIKIKPLLFYIL
jgi:hypothetical protein